MNAKVNQGTVFTRDAKNNVAVVEIQIRVALLILTQTFRMRSRNLRVLIQVNQRPGVPASEFPGPGSQLPTVKFLSGSGAPSIS